MTKADMIETLITETLKKRKSMELYEETFGLDDDLTKIAQYGWSTLYDMVNKFGATREYAKRIR